MKNIKFEPATEARIKAITGIKLPYTSESYVVNYDDEDVAVIGLYRRSAYLTLFCGIKPAVQKELKRYRRVVVLAYRFIMEIVEKQVLPVFAHADEDIDGSDRLLEHMRFTPYKGRVYKWHG